MDSTNEKANLLPVDRVEILVLMDSMADYLLPASDHVVRPPLISQGHIHRTPLLAEHGLSLLIRLFANGSERTILLDAGWSEVGVPHNMKHLGVEPETIEAIVLSHGHIDHWGALLWVLDQISHPVPVVAHPHAFTPVRYLEWEDKVNLIQPDRQAILDRGGQLIESSKPYCSPDSLWASTGQVPRVTEFEKGVPNAYLEHEGRREVDNILDDQSIVVSVRSKGLVVMSGCAHAGIINTIKYGQKITGLEHVHAVIGGFHLSGSNMESVHDQTIEALRAIDPDVIVPMHCTGFTAMARIKEEFPERTLISGVGAKFVFDSDSGHRPS
jgi:7,8-dihydropterin-6-yl-methyl-4-(beta-D-ribofuranosyl)aminobenzene 5'-phosphate synthase